MAIAAWKRLEKSAGYQRRKLRLKRLVGKEPRLSTDIDIRTVEEGGWRYHPDPLDRDSVVYSLGIGKDVEFDRALMRRYGLQVHAFDPTPSTGEWLLENPQGAGFHFHPWAVTAGDGTLTLYPRVRKDGSQSSVMYTIVANDAAHEGAIEVPAYSLSSIASQLVHRRLDLLKMDIEGAEYDVLDTLPDLAVQPRQLLVEFHHRFAGIGPERTVAAAPLRATTRPTVPGLGNLPHEPGLGVPRPLPVAPGQGKRTPDVLYLRAHRGHTLTQYVPQMLYLLPGQ